MATRDQAQAERGGQVLESAVFDCRSNKWGRRRRKFRLTVDLQKGLP
jgi:hypothetical protein